MQPDKEGLVIATRNEETETTKLFLWYYGRPRKFFEDDKVIDNVIYHNGAILGQRRASFSDYVISDLLENEVFATSKKGFKHLCSDGVNLFGTQESDQVVDVEEEFSSYSYRPIKIVCIEENGLEEIMNRHWHTRDLITSDNGFVIAERNFPVMKYIDLESRCCRIKNSSERTFWQSHGYLNPRTILERNGVILMGCDFAIYSENDDTVHLFSEASAYREELAKYHLHDLKGSEYPVPEVREWLKKQNIALPRERIDTINEELRTAIKN